MEQYLYKLRLKAHFLKRESWAQTEEEIISRHFLKLKENTEEGKVILAGRTLNDDDTGFGIVIFEAENETSAEQFMKDDPAISEGMMEGELFPYRVALMREGKSR